MGTMRQAACSAASWASCRWCSTTCSSEGEAPVAAGRGATFTSMLKRASSDWKWSPRCARTSSFDIEGCICASTRFNSSSNPIFGKVASNSAWASTQVKVSSSWFTSRRKRLRSSAEYSVFSTSAPMTLPFRRRCGAILTRRSRPRLGA